VQKLFPVLLTVDRRKRGRNDFSTHHLFPQCRGGGPA
jgi:hypothetical protein